MKLVPDTDPILHKPTPEFEFSEDYYPEQLLKKLVSDMLDFMEANHGMGLAAPQIGMPLRFFVMRTTDGRSLACFNPQIISVSDDTEKGDEGCLSFPDLWLKVRRPIKAEVRYFDQNGNLVNETFENLNARCYMHETDHLNGIVFTTKVSNLSLSMAKKRMHR